MNKADIREAFQHLIVKANVLGISLTDKEYHALQSVICEIDGLHRYIVSVEAHNYGDRVAKPVSLYDITGLCPDCDMYGDNPLDCAKDLAVSLKNIDDVRVTTVAVENPFDGLVTFEKGGKTYDVKISYEYH